MSGAGEIRADEGPFGCGLRTLFAVLSPVEKPTQGVSRGELKER